MKEDVVPSCADVLPDVLLSGQGFSKQQLNTVVDVRTGL